jgi:hypothetical protein
MILLWRCARARFDYSILSYYQWSVNMNIICWRWGTGQSSAAIKKVRLDCYSNALFAEISDSLIKAFKPFFYISLMLLSFKFYYYFHNLVILLKGGQLQLQSIIEILYFLLEMGIFLMDLIIKFLYLDCYSILQHGKRGLDLSQNFAFYYLQLLFALLFHLLFFPIVGSVRLRKLL